jgi:hypothetical protein
MEIGFTLTPKTFLSKQDWNQLKITLRKGKYKSPDIYPLRAKQFPILQIP